MATYATAVAPPPPSPARTGHVSVLLACGIAAAVLEGAMLVFVPLLWPSYSSADQTVSELSAIDAPTRLLWVTLGTIYTALIIAFGWGVRASAGRSRALRVVGAAFLVSGLIGLFWPPMHLREVLAAGGKTLTDTLHIAWTIATGVLMLVAMGFGAWSFGKRFRLYSVATVVVLLAAGALTSVDAPKLEANLPTPGMGVWERVNMGVYLLWVAVLALTLLRRSTTEEQLP